MFIDHFSPKALRRSEVQPSSLPVLRDAIRSGFAHAETARFWHREHRTQGNFGWPEDPQSTYRALVFIRFLGPVRQVDQAKYA